MLWVLFAFKNRKKLPARELCRATPACAQHKQQKFTELKSSSFN